MTGRFALLICVLTMINLKTKYSSKYFISFILTHLCNLKCSYCSDVFKNSHLKLDARNVEKVIRNVLKKGKSLRVRFSGGEPTLYKDLQYLIDLCHSFEVEVELYSNMMFSKPPKLNDSDLIVSSVHNGYTDLDKQFKNIAKNNCNVQFNVLIKDYDDFKLRQNEIATKLKRISRAGWNACPCLIQPHDESTFSICLKKWDEIYNFFVSYCPNFFNTYEIKKNNQEINFSEFFKIVKKLQDRQKKIFLKNQCFWMEENKIICEDMNAGHSTYNIEKFNVDSIKKIIEINSTQIFVIPLLYSQIFFQ